MTKKTVQVILSKNIDTLGKEGTIIKVKPGYLRNYLIPGKLAKVATNTLIYKFELKQKDIEIKEKQFLKNCEENKELLESFNKFVIYKKIKEDGVFFGKITKKQILDLLNEKVKLEMKLNKNQLEFPELKQLGKYTIKIKLANNIIANVNLEILAE
uniref:ribosomal protein L9 n=1 Tax=Sargassum siliquastrum TaxID=127572 RepID=UPI0020799C20|nr:ribosomal protein L9 [Sargassum siliquastrum]YP_010485393.1 50S ribosomal protein L9 [Sargassum macrocarpum]YP_010485532.1 50S ribosomal protein L9 [Sargassum serratifolium]URP30970.1 ribosomal protein L9 [Sargassum siliquastrum]UVW81326.1 50S ribosomal protein L9 [Sargassum macrocarpum]UVW81465.1 50S ribosomal protein L9 [Sargassum serratifolium]